MNSKTVKIGEVEIEVKSISGKYAKICTSLIFSKNGNVVKEASSFDLDRFVRPENRAAVTEAINATRAAVEASAEHAAAIERQNGLDSIEIHQDNMDRTMAVQG